MFLFVLPTSSPVAVVLVSVEGAPVAAVATGAVAESSPAPLVWRPRPWVLVQSPGKMDIRVLPRGEDLGDPSSAPAADGSFRLQTEMTAKKNVM